MLLIILLSFITFLLYFNLYQASRPYESVKVITYLYSTIHVRIKTLRAKKTEFHTIFVRICLKQTA
jgi:hypothetical protein